MSPAATGLRCFTIADIPRPVRERARADAKRLITNLSGEARLFMELRIDQIIDQPGLAGGPHYIPRAAWEAVLGRA